MSAQFIEKSHIVSISAFFAGRFRRCENAGISQDNTDWSNAGGAPWARTPPGAQGIAAEFGSVRGRIGAESPVCRPDGGQMRPKSKKPKKNKKIV
jgi:hypothetical protein